MRVEEAGEHVAQKWILTRGRDNIRDLLPGPILPPVIDKELLVDAEKELGLSLRPYQEAREWLRDAFWERVHREFGISLGKIPGLRTFYTERTVVTQPLTTISRAAPQLRVVRGDATPEEIAALVAVLMATSARRRGQRRRGDPPGAVSVVRTGGTRLRVPPARAPAPGAAPPSPARARRKRPSAEIAAGRRPGWDAASVRLRGG